MSGLCPPLRRLAALCVAAAAFAPGAPAQADGKEACVAAHEQAQLLRRKNALRAARERLLECTGACPAFVQQECVQWLDEVTADQPTFVFEARDRQGDEAPNVQVRVDGELLLERLGGAAVPVDPGERTFEYRMTGEAPLVQKVVVRQGEKNRKLTIDFGGARVEDAGADQHASEPRSVPVVVYVLGGVGAVAMASFAVFAIAGKAKQGELDDCKATRTCDPNDVDAMYDRYLAADISLGVGVATLGASAAVLLWHLGRQPATTGTRVIVSPLHGGARAGLIGTF